MLGRLSICGQYLRISGESPGSAETACLRKVSQPGEVLWRVCILNYYYTMYLAVFLLLTWDFGLVAKYWPFWSDLCFILEYWYLNLTIKSDMYFIDRSSLPGGVSYREEFSKYAAVLWGNTHEKWISVTMELCWHHTAAWKLSWICSISAKHLSESHIGVHCDYDNNWRHPAIVFRYHCIATVTPMLNTNRYARCG